MAVTTPVLVKRFLDLTDKRKTHEDAADTIKTELAALQDELIVRFQNSGVRSMAFNGCRTIYIHRQLWAGRPARYMRDLSDEALIDMREGVDHYVHNAKAHKGAVKAAYE